MGIGGASSQLNVGMLIAPAELQADMESELSVKLSSIILSVRFWLISGVVPRSLKYNWIAPAELRVDIVFASSELQADVESKLSVEFSCILLSERLCVILRVLLLLAPLAQRTLWLHCASSSELKHTSFLRVRVGALEVLMAKS